MLWVIVSGSRDYRPLWAVRDRVEVFPAGTHVIVGKARGVDTHAEKVADYNGFEVHPMPALWETHGRRAGHIRNDAMLDRLEHELEREGNEGLVCAFHDGISPGTASMIAKTRLRCIPMEVYDAAGRMTSIEDQLALWRKNYRGITDAAR